MCEDEDTKSLSYAAREIKRIKAAVIEATEKRERLPQPLFWSLFHTALKNVRDAKDRKRLLSELLEP